MQMLRAVLSLPALQNEELSLESLIFKQNNFVGIILSDKLTAGPELLKQISHLRPTRCEDVRMEPVLGISASLEEACPLFSAGGRYQTHTNCNGCIPCPHVPQCVQLGADPHLPILPAGVAAVASARCLGLLQQEQTVPDGHLSPGAALQLVCGHRAPLWTADCASAMTEVIQKSLTHLTASIRSV